MIKFFNETATITYRQDTSAIHVAFHGQGSRHDYRETICVAERIASIHQASAYVLEKHAFDDLSVDEYGRLLLKWIAQLDKKLNGYPLDIQQRVALFSPPAFSVSLNQYFRENAEVYFHTIYKVFASRERVNQFLKTKEAASRPYQINDGYGI